MYNMMENDTQGFRILIVEDEAILGMDLSLNLQREGYEVLEVIDNGEQALSLYKKQEIDLVLLDIQLKGKLDGIETAEQMTQIKPVPIIYITAQLDEETLDRAKETFPAAYLPKPFNPEGLKIAVDLAIHNFAKKREETQAKIATALKEKEANSMRETILQIDNHIFIKQSYQFTKVRLSDILFLESDNNYVNIITHQKKFTLRLTLNGVLERINYTKLLRTHRSFAINMEQIESFNDHEVLIGKYTIPLGRNYKDEFLRYFDFL